MVEGYKFNSLIICDDARLEASGKEILIGVYNDAIVSPTFPFQLPSICFRVSVRLERENFKNMNFTLRSPSGKDVIATTQKVLSQSNKMQTIFIIGFANPMFDVTGTYSVMFGLDRPAERIGTIELKLPETPEETRRVAGATTA